MESLFPTQRARRQTNEARQVEEESKAREARRVDKSRRRRDEFGPSKGYTKKGDEGTFFPSAETIAGHDLGTQSTPSPSDRCRQL